LDASADASAAALGEELGPERATIAARESRLTCARALEASKTNARNSQFTLAKTIAKRKPVWMPEQDAVVDAAANECRELVGQFTIAFAALEKERLLQVALATFPVQGSLVGVRLGRINAPTTGTDENRGRLQLAVRALLNEAVETVSTTCRRRKVPFTDGQVTVRSRAAYLFGCSGAGALSQDPGGGRSCS
jgi:hypothetical protein